jgi:PIN domain nuclease of toxin-antitoxin system
VTSEHAWRAGTLPHGHRDPFDRMLAAPSELERLTPVAADGAFLSFQVHALW